MWETSGQWIDDLKASNNGYINIFHLVFKLQVVFSSDKFV